MDEVLEEAPADEALLWALGLQQVGRGDPGLGLLVSVELALSRIGLDAPAMEEGAGIRLAVGGRAGFAYTSDLSSAGVETAFRNALANAVSSSALDVDILADNHEADNSAALHSGPHPERESESLVQSVIGMESECLDSTLR